MKKRSVLVIGAGFSGLSAAHHLVNAGFEVEVREAASRVGGLIKSTRNNSALFESAANGILNSALVEDLFRAAEVELVPTSREARSRYIVKENKLRKWPLGFFDTLSVIKAAFTYLLNRKSLIPLAGESVAEWGARSLSKSASRFTIETALQGIYAGDPEKLSATLILGRLFEPKTETQQKPSVRGTVSARDGMESLLKGLRDSLEKRGVAFKLNSSVSASEIEASARPVVIATGAKHASTLLNSVDPERATAVSEIELLPIVSVSLVFAEGSFHKKGFGYLFPPGSAKVLGVLMSNWIFPERAKPGSLLETWILGGAFAEKNFLARSDQEILNLILAERAKLAGNHAQPLEFQIQRWPEALPHLTVDVEKRSKAISENRKNVFLLGNYTGGIGLARILDQAAKLPGQIESLGKWNEPK